MSSNDTPLTPPPGAPALDAYFESLCGPRDEDSAEPDRPPTAQLSARERLVLARVLVEAGRLREADELAASVETDEPSGAARALRVDIAVLRLDGVAAAALLDGESTEVLDLARRRLDAYNGVPDAEREVVEPGDPDSPFEVDRYLARLAALGGRPVPSGAPADDAETPAEESIASEHGDPEETRDETLGGSIPQSDDSSTASPATPSDFEIAEAEVAARPGAWRAVWSAVQVARREAAAAREERDFDSAGSWLGKGLAYLEDAVERFPEVTEIAFAEYEAEIDLLRVRRRELSRSQYRDQLETLTGELTEWVGAQPFCPRASARLINLNMELATMYYIRGGMRRAASITAPNLELFAALEAHVPGCTLVDEIDRRFLSSPPKGLFGSMLKRRASARPSSGEVDGDS